MLIDSKNTAIANGPLVLVTQQNGVTVIPQPTPLTRLNYFDGKFLRASDLSAEQLYLRRLVQLSNQAGGPGVAYGYNLSLAAGGDTLNVGPGLAIDPQGHVLLLPEAISIGVQELIDGSRRLKRATATPSKDGNFAECTVVKETPPGGLVQAGNLYLITIGFAEALCGQEDVFGKLCEEACVTSTDRPYLVEGVVLRAVPLQLQTPLPTSAVVALNQLHLRSRVASSYFEDERKKIASFISSDGLHSDVWCFGAEAAGGQDVPIGVLARAGATTLFLDAWIARRERIDPPAKRYWQWRMAMRPWDVLLAQILQFQCQLSDLFKKRPQAGGGGDDPCANAHSVLREASATVAKVANFYQAVTTRFTLQPLLVSGRASAENAPVLEGGLAALVDFQKRLQAVSAATLLPSDKVLIDGNIIETPPVAYLPVTASSVVSVNEQVRRLLGKGVDLQFCIVRPDFVAHALEEAQHMERISLIEGLDHPDRKPEVDVLVPNGEPLELKPAAGAGYEAELRAGDLPAALASGAFISRVDRRPVLRGAAHVEAPQSGKVEIFTAVDLDPSQRVAGVLPVRPEVTIGRIAFGQPSGVAVGLATAAAGEAGQQSVLSLWGAVTCSLNPFAAPSSGQALLEIRIVLASGVSPQVSAQDFLLNGTVTFADPITVNAKRVVKGTFSGTLSVVSKGGNQPQETTTRQSLEVIAILSTPDGQAPSLQLTFVSRQAKLAIEMSASWSGSPRKITFGLKEIALADIKQTQTLFDSIFAQNDDVLLPANQLHAAALAALEKIGAVLADQQFSPKSAALLFPPPPPSAADLQVRATLDWVLFHRRRTKQCQREKAVVVVPPRRYQLWHGLVANQDFLKKTIETLHGKEKFDPDGVAFQRVDIVEFAPGIETLISPADTVQSDWSQVKPGNRLVYAAIASGDAAKQDGPDLARGRLGEVEQAVASVSTPDPAAPPEVLDAIHPDLAVPDVDGIIVMLTMLQINCITLVAVKSADGLATVRKAIETGALTSTVIKRLGSIIGQVEFAVGTVEVQNNSLEPVVKKWKEAGLQELSEPAPLIAWQPDVADVPDAIALSQGRFIQNALAQGAPGPLPAPELVKSPKPLPDCPAILFIVGSQG
jgi:hypothetical protein